MAFNNYNEQAKLHEVRALIKQKRYGQAMQILEELDTPEARKLHEKMVSRLMPEIDTGDHQASNQSSSSMPIGNPKRYRFVKILSFGVMFIALVYLIVGISIIQNGEQPNFVMFGGQALVVGTTDAALITIGESFFIFVAGVTLNMLADMASNISESNHYLKRLNNDKK